MKRVIIILRAVLLVCLVLGGFGVYWLATFQMFPPYDYATGFDNPADFREHVEQYVGCELPKKLTDLRMVHGGGKDPTIWIAFRVDPAALPQLRSDISSDPWEAQLPELPRNILEEMETWWQPPTDNISVLWRHSQRKGLWGTLWITDNPTGRVYFCHYSS